MSIPKSLFLLQSAGRLKQINEFFVSPFLSLKLSLSLSLSLSSLSPLSLSFFHSLPMRNPVDVGLEEDPEQSWPH